MCDHEDCVSFTDLAVSSFDQPCVPLCHACPHGGHAKLSIVWVIKLPDGRQGTSMYTSKILRVRLYEFFIKCALLHISFYRPARVFGGLLKGVLVRQDLADHLQHMQKVEVRVSQHWFLLLQAFMAEFYDLENDRNEALICVACFTRHVCDIKPVICQWFERWIQPKHIQSMNIKLRTAAFCHLSFVTWNFPFTWQLCSIIPHLQTKQGLR